MPLARDKNGSFVPVSWKEALGIAASAMGRMAGTQMAALAGPLVDVESLVVLKDIMNELGSTSTSSTAVALPADLRAAYTLNSTIAGLEACDALLLVGTNPRIEAPLLNARLRKLVRHQNLPVASVGEQIDLTYDVQHIGESAAALSDLLAGKGAFATHLKDAKKPAVLIGLGALNRADGPAVGALASQLAAASGCLTDGWNGFSVLQSVGGAVGALDVGFVPGPTAVALSDASLVYLLGADEGALHEISSDAFVIYQGHHGDAGAEIADLILPGSAYTEKIGTYVNTEGRVQRTRRALDPPGNAREDWSILVALSKIMGRPLPYETLEGVHERMRAIAPQLSDASGDVVEPSSAALSALALEYVPPGAPAVSTSALCSSMSNFYMTDSISRASATMAKCVQTYGTRA